ncbi:MAG TPA: nitrous oxide-stimulated promoter family protein [Thermogutta sp.]|nr:nitrous oxide-stimulated promoter family protein [Thermogutta sp.]HPZ83802.1 nitrous oxide-stimulated promoter family protein [Thermogutta sp.]HQF14585.1 nitrous oxide-stimulated promoter family protein [Thermogutta sp.]
MLNRSSPDSLRASRRPETVGLPARLRRELRTIEAMIHIYCRKKHPYQGKVCPDCQELLHYAACRLEHCPFGSNKPTCARCPIHCYRPAMREKIRQVMRLAGPWMLLYHPYLCMRHYLDEWLIAPPERPRREA